MKLKRQLRANTTICVCVLCVHVSTFVYAHICMGVCVSTFVCMRPRVCMRVHVCPRVCMCVCIYVCIFIFLFPGDLQTNGAVSFLIMQAIIYVG